MLRKAINITAGCTILKIFLHCVCVCVYECQCLCGGQRAAYGSWFHPFVIWVLRSNSGLRLGNRLPDTV